MEHKAEFGIFFLIVGLSEEEAIALQNKLDAFYTIMNQEVEVLKEQSKKIQRERDVQTSKSILILNFFCTKVQSVGKICIHLTLYFLLSFLSTGY